MPQGCCPAAGQGRWGRVGLQLAQDELEQGGLTRAVGLSRLTLSPRRMVAEKSRTTTRPDLAAGPPQGRGQPPGGSRTVSCIVCGRGTRGSGESYRLKGLVRWVSSDTSLPLAAPTATSIFTLPWRCAGRRARRAGHQALMRAWARVRRASTLCESTPSCASSLSARALMTAFLRRLLGLGRLEGGKVAGIGGELAAVELHDARGHAVQEARSWVMTTCSPWELEQSSSHSMASSPGGW